MDEYTKAIFNSDPQTISYKINGSADLAFTKLSVNIARELGAPENNDGYITNSSGLWNLGAGKDKTVLLIQLNPSKTGSGIRFKTGGGRGRIILNQVEEIAKHVFEIYTSEFIRL